MSRVFKNVQLLQIHLLTVVAVGFGVVAGPGNGFRSDFKINFPTHIQVSSFQQFPSLTLCWTKARGSEKVKSLQLSKKRLEAMLLQNSADPLT